MDNTEIDIFEFVQRGEDVPHAPAYIVRIDGEKFRIDTPRPTGEQLLQKVDKRPCAFELIEEFAHHENNVVEPKEEVDLRKKDLKGFITAQKEIVTIFINGVSALDRAREPDRCRDSGEGQGNARRIRPA